MTGTLFVSPVVPALSAAGIPLDGAKWYFYLTGTLTPADTYTTSALSVAHTNPVVAGLDGKFDSIYYDSETLYRGILKDKNDNVIDDIDPINSIVSLTTLSFTQSGTGAATRTALAKMRERVTVLDFTGGDFVTQVATALTNLGTASPARLVFPKGAYTIGQNVDWSANRNVTFVFEPGCVISHSTFTIVLPERVDIQLGASFSGTGAITVKNTDQLLLSTPPANYVVAGNYANGVGALKNVTTGFNNFGWGYKALNSLTSGRSNIAIGVDTLKSVTGGTATSASGTYMSEGDGNVAIGDMTLRALTTGYENVGVGMYNMYALTTGRWNVCLGVQNLELNTTGECNVAIGPYALVTATGSNNVGIGFSVMENQTTGSNVGIGYVALGGSTTSTRNTAVGSQAMQLCETGTDNVTVGQEALKNATAPVNCVAIGAYSLGQATGASTNNTAVGKDALLAITTGSSNTAVGSGANNALTTQTNATAIGFNTQCIASNQVTLGDGNVTSLRCAVTSITAISDERFKRDIETVDLPDGFLDEVRIVSYNWIDSNKGDERQLGIIAQQLDAIQEKYGVQWLGLVDKTNPDRWEATPGKLLFLAVLKLQRMTARVEGIEARLTAAGL